MKTNFVINSEEEEWWAALEEKLRLNKLAGGDGRLIPLPQHQITQSEWSGDDDGVNDEHQLLYDSDMRD